MGNHSYLLDTNIISALAREPGGVVYAALKSRLPAGVCTSIVVAAEIEYGLYKSGSQRLRKQVEAILSGLDILPLQAPVHRHYREIRTYLQSIGQPIGHNDLFIAAHAQALGLIMVTGNVSEFERVPGLTVENWLVS